MTPAQHGRYWREWGRIRKHLIEDGEFSPKEADEERSLIHERALGGPKSSKDLKNADLDKIFSAFKKYLVLIDGPSKSGEVDQERKRLIFAIEKYGLDDAYLNKIALDQFKEPSWRDLDTKTLRFFRFTAKSRAGKKSSK
ncbi:MAG: hypothetical protein QM680_14325 [Luteolibacter sp.]